MKFKAHIIPYILQFKNPAGTSRGVYYQHKVWYVVLSSITDTAHIGVGECAPLPDLSCDAMPESEYLKVLQKAIRILEDSGEIDYEYLRPYPSILFGLETALKHFSQKSLGFWNTGFSKGEKGIEINGLIWMGNFDMMLNQIKQKIEQGYGCIKLKIGAINFDQELNLLKHIRQHFSSEQITLRVDANGAFTIIDAYEKLNRLSKLDLHSIEQPIMAGKWQEMAKLAAVTPLPIALDEELIGCNEISQKRELLETIMPQYIILKPSLHGGWKGCQEWIDIASEKNIGWWITSALESNIGLNAIAQWCAYLDVVIPQGLGTGMLYTNNIDLPLYIDGDKLRYNPIEESLNNLSAIFNV
ncbi:MAG: o-succinylbenzoate synthase [Dysgonomonas sp.]